MIGYLKPDLDELKVKELKLYNSYYCGICTSISKKYGPFSRLLLSYDAVFFSILSDVKNGKIEFGNSRCPLPPFQKKRIVKSEGVSFGTEISKFFSELKIEDFKRDSRGIKHFLSFFLLNLKSKIFKEIGSPYIKELYFYELTREPNPEKMAEIFGNFSRSLSQSIENLKNASTMIYLIGKWVYLADALDDLEKDFKGGNYNPFLEKYKDIFEITGFFDKIRERERTSLVFLVSRIQEEYMKLNLENFAGKPLIENVIFYGLPKVNKKIIEKKDEKIERSI
ncbi:DUF5685 family protein [Athalassotoga saccharophila]|uniref:DUF5685 family protein n=1 Tax=Athalassotoga saccharophila TaxID=1441386 RepID=UPI001379FB4C|nr:DUF5685 family protein [Athalassotoga saccharophila]BBJ27978.1 hypothetical protein ATHSA_0878 [Athalassotoga saccharophila]